MGRIRMASLAGIALVLVAAGTVFATRQPQEPSPVAGVADEEDEAAPPSAEDLAHAADRLRANEIAVDDAQLGELSAEYGVGGAVRILAWSADPDDDVTVDSIRAMRDGDGTEGSAMGWGRIARELGVHPGLGSIMGNGGGHGRDSAPGQGRDDDAGD